MNLSKQITTLIFHCIFWMVLQDQKGFDLELADSAFKTIKTSIKTKNETNQLFLIELNKKLKAAQTKEKLKLECKHLIFLLLTQRENKLL